MCGGGGGGGDGGAAQRKTDEEARVAAAIATINDSMGVENGDTQASKDAFAQRQGLYSTISQDATNKAKVDLDKERAITERNLGFDIARSGLSGGSRDIDANRDVLDTYQQGVLRAGEMGNTASTNARAADDKTRVRLIDSVRTGLDSGSAVNQAYSEMRNNSSQALNDAAGANLTGFFDRLNNQVRQVAYDKGMQAGGVVPPTQQKPNQPTGSNGTVFSLP